MSKLLRWFNPSLRQYIDDYQDVTLVGLFWSLYWRFIVAIWLFALALTFIVLVLDVIF